MYRFLACPHFQARTLLALDEAAGCGMVLESVQSSRTVNLETKLEGATLRNSEYPRAYPRATSL